MKNAKVFRVLGLVTVATLLVVAIVASMNHKTPNSEKVWYPEMTVGNLDAKNYFVVYSDIACPYCLAFENAIVEHQEEFEEYIAANDILLEVRVADFLYEFGESNPIESRYGAEAIYCAKNAGKFWEYYDLAVTRVWQDYFGVAGKASFADFNRQGLDYWVAMGREIGLGDDFEKCVTEGETLAEIEANAQKMTKFVSGMPYFKFNDYVLSGFDLSWGWNYVLKYFDAGLKS